jgi:hypothetical protein
MRLIQRSDMIVIGGSGEREKASRLDGEMQATRARCRLRARAN